MPVVDAVVLAAGASRRTHPIHKLTADLGGRPVIAWVLDAVVPYVREIVAITAGDAAVEALLAPRCRIVRNPEPGRGMSASLLVGVEALRPDADGLLQVLGDMPLVRGADVASLIASLRTDRVVLPVHGGKRGHPVLWGSAAFPVLRAQAAVVSARDLLAAGSIAVEEVAIDHDGILFDVDTPTSLAEARRRVGRT
jgi:molybdenum cofactor cytidylyltransferase